MQWFGEIHEGKMILSELGNVAKQCVLAIPLHFPHTEIDEFCVMPNHVHVIITFKPFFVETQNFASLQKTGTRVGHANIFGPQSKNLGSIIRGYKIGVTKEAKKFDLPFRWQPRYHDHIIRSENELIAIKNYIAHNPKVWDKECIPWHADAAYYSV